MKCRITKKKCNVFLDLGKMPLANGFLKKNFRNEYFFPLKVGFSNSLNLVQLMKCPNPKNQPIKKDFLRFSPSINKKSPLKAIIAKKNQ